MKTIRKILSRVAFFLALFIMLAFLRDTLLIKETTGIVPMKAYYGQPKGTVDVLILGSSHAGMNLSTQTLWDEYGISSYVLWGAVQPLWNTYHNLLEALKTQTPKLVVVEMYIASTDEEYADKTRQVTNTIGMNLSLNKWDAIRVSAPPERWLDMLMELPLTHGHYKDLEEKDFHYYPWSDVTAEKGSVSLGYEIFDGMEEFTDELVDASTIREVKPLGEKSGSYLFKIIDLCKEKQLPLLLVLTPTLGRKSEQPYYNRMAQIAEENGLTFINCNLLDEETGFDVDCDFHENHINERGNRKITRYLAEYITKNYDIPDHRGDPKYESWEVSSRNMQNDRLCKITEVRDYFEELVNSRYICYLVKEYGLYPMTESYKELIKEIEPFGDEQTDLARAMEDEWGFDVAFQCAGTPTGDIRLLGEEEKGEIGFSLDYEDRNVLFNGEKICDYADEEIHLLVYDPYSKICVDEVKFTAEGEYKLERHSEDDEEE